MSEVNYGRNMDIEDDLYNADLGTGWNEVSHEFIEKLDRHYERINISALTSEDVDADGTLWYDPSSDKAIYALEQPLETGTGLYVEVYGDVTGVRRRLDEKFVEEIQNVSDAALPEEDWNQILNAGLEDKPDTVTRQEPRFDDTRFRGIDRLD